MPATLSTLVLKDFKSFQGQHDFNFSEKFIGITGPNGCGKSNILDALAFGFGAKANERLRVENAKNLVNTSAESSPTDVDTFVSITFVNDNNEQIEFTRIINEDYQIRNFVNNEPCSERNYLNELKKVGIDVKAGSFIVRQGMMAQFCSMDSKALCEYLEQASGSFELKARYNRLKRALDVIKAEQKNNIDQKKILLKDKEKFLHETEKNREYRELQKELQDVSMMYYMACLFEITEDMTSLQNNLSTKEDDLGRLNAAIENAKQAIQRAKADAEGDRSNSARSRSEQLEIKMMEANLKVMENSIELEKKSIDTLKKNIAKKEQEIQNGLEVIEANEVRLQEFQDSMVKLEETALEKSFTLQQEQEYERLKQLLANEVSNENEEALRQIESDLQQAQFREENCKRIWLDYKARKSQDDNRIIMLGTKLGNLTEEIRNEQEKKQEIEAKIAAYQEKSRQVQALSNEIDELSGKLGHFEVSKKLMEEEQRKEDILRKLREQFPDRVFDRIGNLYEIREQNYNRAIERVMGKYNNVILVKDYGTVKECLDFMTREKFIKEKFFPLDQAGSTVCPLNENVLGNLRNRGVFFVHEKMVCGEEFKKVMQYLAGNVLVCQHSADAQNLVFNELSRKVDCISLDGSWYKKSGEMDFEFGESDAVPSSQQYREWRKNKGDLETKRNVLKKELEGINEGQLEDEKKRSEAKLKFMTEDKENTEKELAELERLQAEERQEERVRESKSDVDEAEIEVAVLNEKLKQAKRASKEAKERIFQDFIRRLKIETITNYEELSDRLLREENMERELNMNHARALETQENDKKRLEENREKLKRLQDDLKKKEIDLANLKDQSRMLKEDIDQSTRTLSENNSLSTIRESLASLTKRRKELEKDIANIQRESKQLKQRKNNLLNEVLENGLQLQMYTDRSGQEYYDFDLLEDEYKTDRNKKNELQKKREDLTEAVQRCNQNPSHVSDRGERIDDGLRDVYNKISGVKPRLKKASSEFDKVRKERRGRFNSLYESVNEKVHESYKELTRDPNVALLLHSKNEDEPYLETIQLEIVPPKKLYNPTNTLSTGERSLASFLIMLAINKTTDSPVMALDEVDANLDSKRRAQVKDYLKNKYGHATKLVASLNPNFLDKSDIVYGVTEKNGQRRVFSTSKEQNE